MLRNKPELGTKLDSFKCIGGDGVKKWFNIHKYTVVGHHHSKETVFIEHVISGACERLNLPTEQFRRYVDIEAPLIEEACELINASHQAAELAVEALIKAGYRKVIPHNREFSKGEVEQNDMGMYTAGIHVPGHMNAIERYAGTKKDAENTRDEILARLSL